MSEFTEYVAAGWQLVEFNRGEKGPSGPRAVGWNARERAIRDPQQVNGMQQGGLLHAYSNTCALDIDNLSVARPFLKELGIDIDALLTSRDAVQISSGRPNRAKLIYHLPAPLVSRKLCRYENILDGKKYHAIELRCAARNGLSVQDVLPPSVHPDTGRPYEWKYGNDLVGSWRNLPEIPPKLLALWQNSAAEPDEETESTVASGALPDDAPLEEIAYYLEVLDPDTYDDWLAVGMAIHHETAGAPEGLALWDQWSRKSEKYGEAKGDKPPQYPADKWAGFKLSTQDRTLGTLKLMAAEMGQPPYLAPNAFPVVAEREFVAPSATEINRGVDTRPGALIRSALAPLVFVVSQERFFDCNRRVLLKTESIDQLYTPLMPVLHITGNNGAVKTVLPKPSDELRRAAWKEEVFGLRMHPGEGKYFREHGQRFLNTYEKPAIEPLAPTPDEQDAFNFMWSRPDEKVFRDWLLQFFAHAVQKPGVKIRMFPLLVGNSTGSGKNTLMKILPQLLFTPQYVTTMTSDILRDKYSDQLVDAWWVYFEELHSGSAKAERISLFNRVKPWITDDTFTVRPMYGKAYVAPNRIQVTASSNYEDDAIHIDDNDRRTVVGHIERSMTKEEGDDLYRFLESPRAPGVLQHIFQNVSLTGFNPNGRAPETAAKRVMVRVNYGHWESELLEMISNGTPPFDKDMFEARDVLPYVKSSGITATRLGRIMGRAPFNFTQMPPCYGQRLWVWRNVDLWKVMGPSARKAYYDGAPRPVGHPWTNALPRQLAEACGVVEPEPPPVCDLI